MYSSSIKHSLHLYSSFSKEETEYFQSFAESNKLLLNASSDAIIGINEQSQIAIWNDQAATMFGWKREAVIGQSVNIIISKRSQSQLLNILKSNKQTINESTQNQKVELIAINRTNKAFPIELRVATVQDREHLFFCLFIHRKAENGKKISNKDHHEIERIAEQKQREFTAALISAQETERSIVGQELHDNVNQVLTTIKLYNEMLLDGIGEPKEIIKKSVLLLQNCIDEIRTISKRLSAPTLGNINLQDSIKELVEAINITGRINVIYTIDGFSSSDTSKDTHLGIYRIVQEHLNNIVEYADASYATITIIREQGKLTLIIQDDGKGFNVHAETKGIGIANMKSRAEQLNGNFTIWSQTGKGCKLQVTIPLR